MILTLSIAGLIYVSSFLFARRQIRRAHETIYRYTKPTGMDILLVVLPVYNTVAGLLYFIDNVNHDDSGKSQKVIDKFFDIKEVD